MHVNPGTSPPVEAYITVSARMVHDTATSDHVAVGTHQFTVTTASDDWVEIALTEGLQNLLSGTETSQLEVTFQSKLSCKEQGTETAINFADPILLLFTDAEIDVSMLSGLGLGGEAKRHTPLRPSRLFSRDVPGSGDSTSPTVGCSGYVQSTGQCSREPLLVDFQEDLGTNFILQPRIVDIGYCNGKCNPASVHSEFLRLLTSSRGQTAPNSAAGYKDSSCCVPTHYLPVEILLRVENVLVIEELQNAIVTNCCCIP